MIVSLERNQIVVQCCVLSSLVFCCWASAGAEISERQDPISTKPIARPSLAHSHEWKGKSSYVVDSWQTEQGLPRNTVLSMTQTADGYIWLGTSYGLARFDGIQFTVFNSANTPGMVHGRIASLLADRQGRLWIASDQGELTFMEKGRALRVPKPSQGEINCLAEDDKGRIWVGAGNGLGFVDAGVVNVPQIHHRTKPVRRIGFDSKANVLWFDQDGILFAMREGQFIPIKQNGTNSVIDVNTFAMKMDGGIWFVDMARKLGRSLPDQTFTSTVPLPMSTPGWVAPMREDRRGNLWFSVSERGLYRLGLDGAVEHFSTSSGLRDNNVASILEDSEGNIWVGTNNGGVHRFKRRTFRVFDAQDGLLDEIVFSVSCDPNGKVYCSTRSGHVYRVDGDRLSRIGVGTAQTLAWDASGRLWGNWFGGVLAAYRPDGDQFLKVEKQEDRLYNRCTVIESGSGGRVWLGGHYGLGCFGEGGFDQVMDPALLPRDWVRALASGPDGTLWVGLFARGLYAINAGRSEAFRRRDGLPSDMIQALFVDSGGVLWIGTAEEGLVRFHEGRFTHYTKANGLADNSICGIVEDNHGELWMSSFRGIFRVARADLNRFANQQQRSIRCFVYGTTDGLVSAECTSESQPNICKTPDGKLWFATSKGLAVVDPGEIEVNTNIPPVVIEEIVIDGVALPLASGRRASDPPIVIPAGTQRVELRYTGLSFVSPEQVQFQYRLEGHEATGVHAGSRRTAYYTKVPPGQYQFRAKAVNNNGVWNEAGAVLPLIFMPHFWQTWWFASIAILAGAGSIAGIVRHFAFQKLRQQLIHTEHQRALDGERSRIAQDMHDQLGSHLTRIGLLSEIVKQHRADDAKLEAHFQGIAGIARDLAGEMDQVVWAVNPKKDSLEDLASYCCSYAEEFFALTPISCRIDLPDDLPDLRLSSKTRYQFFLAFKEALNNLAKHAQATEVILRWSLTAEVLVLCVEDNGKGFDVSRVTQGRNGMGNMKDRMASIKGCVEITSVEGSGTRIKFVVPRTEPPGLQPPGSTKFRHNS